MYVPDPINEKLLYDVDGDTVAMIDDVGHAVVLQNRHGDAFEDRIICLSPEELEVLADTLWLMCQEWREYRHD